MVRMIVTDLDHTLLRTDKTVSAFTYETLRACMAKGIKLAYATGRGGTAKKRVPSAEFDGRITMNGAMIYEGEELVHSCLVPAEKMRDLLVPCSERGLRVVAEMDDMHYANFDVGALWHELEDDYRIVDFRELDIDAEKLYVLPETDEERTWLSAVMPEGIYMVISADGLAQVMNVGASKSLAIARLAARWGIEMADVVAFGDDVNDTDMLQACGLGIAMGNAVEEVKAVADAVCDTQDNDGLAKWLREHVLG